MVYAQDNGGAVLAIVAAGSIVAFLYNVTHNTLMKRTSSVAVSSHGWQTIRHTLEKLYLQ